MNNNKITRIKIFSREAFHEMKLRCQSNGSENSNDKTKLLILRVSYSAKILRASKLAQTFDLGS
jgi:hypothetical protein